MTIIAAIADLHVANHRMHGGGRVGGVNERGQFIVDAFGNALSIAEAHNAEVLIGLGDVFDTTKPEPQLIAAVGRMMEHHQQAVKIIKGNHDEQSSDPGDHALGPLALHGQCEIVEEPTYEVPGGTEVIYLPFMTGPAKEWLPRVLDQMRLGKRANGRVLCVHLGIHDTAIRMESPWAGMADDAISAEQLASECFKHGIDLVLAGNWHGRKVIGFTPQAGIPNPHGIRNTTLVQVGALVPTGWDNPGLEGYGSVALAEFSGGELIDLSFPEVSGPRFVNVVSGQELQVAVAKCPSKCDLYVRWTCQPDGVTYATDMLSKLKAAAQIKAFEVRTDKAVAKTQARQAAEAARSTSTLQGVLDAFVSKMPLPEGVERDRIFNLAKGYLEG